MFWFLEKIKIEELSNLLVNKFPWKNFSKGKSITNEEYSKVFEGILLKEKIYMFERTQNVFVSKNFNQIFIVHSSLSIDSLKEADQVVSKQKGVQFANKIVLILFIVIVVTR